MNLKEITGVFRSNKIGGVREVQKTSVQVSE
jgi:hypothetical protein